MRIWSNAFGNGSAIPPRHTCDGDDVSPPLAWADLPPGTMSLALVVDDPDAPDPAAPQMTWVHWVVYNIPPTATGLAEGVREFPPGTQHGLNDWKRAAYGGPCPPIGRHRYFHRLYALDTTLELRDPTSARLAQAMRGHVLAEAQLVGTYARKK